MLNCIITYLLDCISGCIDLQQGIAGEFKPETPAKTCIYKNFEMCHQTFSVNPQDAFQIKAADIFHGAGGIDLEFQLFIAELDHEIPIHVQYSTQVHPAAAHEDHIAYAVALGRGNRNRRSIRYDKMVFDLIFRGIKYRLQSGQIVRQQHRFTRVLLQFLFIRFRHREHTQCIKIIRKRDVLFICG